MRVLQLLPLLGLLAPTILATPAPVPKDEKNFCQKACRDPDLQTDEVSKIATKYATGKTNGDGSCSCTFSAGACKGLCADLAQYFGWPDEGYCRPEEDRTHCTCYVPEGTPGSTEGDTQCVGKGSYKPPKDPQGNGGNDGNDGSGGGDDKKKKPKNG